MNTILNILNFVGVLLLAALCSAQWHTNNQLLARANDLEQVRQQQADKLDQEDKTIKTNAADLESTRDQLKDAQTKVASLTAERNQLSSERDQYKANLEKWMASVTQFNNALKERNAQYQTAMTNYQKAMVDRNDAVTRLNDLTNKYNTVVKELNTRNAAAAHG